LADMLKVELDIGKDEAELNELTEEMRKVAACLSFVPDLGTLNRVEWLARKCSVKRLAANKAYNQIKEVLLLVTKPDSLVKMMLEKVVHIKLPTEDLPGTLRTQLLEWPKDRRELIRNKSSMIDDLLVDTFDELDFNFGS
jgi:uncharacterized protein YerC